MPIRRKRSPAVPAIRFSGGASFRTARERNAALPLIRRLAAAYVAAVDYLPLGAAILESLAGGRSAAYVFKLTPLFGPEHRRKGRPVVVKIAPRAQGAHERANYDKFVRRSLPVACRPELLGFVQTRTHAGLCYSFVGGDGVDTLTAYLQRGDTKKLALVLDRIFDRLHDTWYGARSLRRESDIARRYFDRYFTGVRWITKTETALHACAARYFNARRREGRIVIGGEISFPSPRAVLFGSDRKRPYRSCIIHGDLNTDNIVVADAPARVTLIDFQKTGRGHVHEDLVALEASVRINYLKDRTAPFSDILETERLIALGRRLPGDPYAAAIRKIRAAALRYFSPIEDAANYHFAVAAIGLRLMRATDLSHIARARITASALWATKALAGETLD